MFAATIGHHRAQDVLLRSRMPFTISHAAAVLPLRRFRARLPLAALMIGSMSPDFAYFLPGDPDRIFTHSIPGIFWFCWPVSIAAWLLFVRVLEQPTIALLPESWQTRFASSKREMTVATLALASIAVMLGAATHIVWDSFTHRGTAVVHAIPALHAVAFRYDGWPIRWFMVLQHASSVVGILLLAIWAWRLPPGRYPRQILPSVPHATRVRAVAVLVAASLGLAITGYLLNSDLWLGRRLFHFAIGGMTGWMLAWCAVAIVISWKARSTH
jgi:hypothetical protein